MAVRLGSCSSGDDLEVRHEINAKPLIDAILVLLIIFMVAAPPATIDLSVNLPASTAAEQPRQDKPVFVAIKPRPIAVGENIISRDLLASALDTATSNHKNETIFVRSDKTLTYGDLIKAMNSLRRARHFKLALVGLDVPAAKP
jgi:biopolymer transport protein ExbD